MLRIRICAVLLPIAFIIAVAMFGSPRTARSSGIQKAQPRYDLFYNYYAGQYGGQPAQMYLSPRPTPPFVGHTYVTYQPLLPHEFLYKHSRIYHRYNVYDCGATKTCVCWW